MEALAHLDRNGYGGLITQRLHDDDDDHDVDDDDPVDATVTMMTMVLMMLITVLFWLVARHLPQRGRPRLRPAHTCPLAHLPTTIACRSMMEMKIQKHLHLPISLLLYHAQRPDLLEAGACEIPCYKSAQRPDLLEAGAC